MTKKMQLIYLGIVLVFIGACATPQSATHETGNPGKLISRLGEDIAYARSNSVDILSPTWFDKAETLYGKAKTGLEEGTELSSINNYIDEANVSLKKAGEFAKISETILGDTIKARQKALDVGADKLGKPFSEVENQYLKLTGAIEDDNVSYAQKHAKKVQASFRDLEIMAIKDTALRDVREMMAKAKKAKIQKIVPKTYADAEQSLSEADAYIGQNPYKGEAISQKTAAADFMARRMTSITISSNMYKGMEPEESALYLEGLLGRLSTTMGTGDIRNKSVDDQVNTLVRAGDNMNQTIASQKSQIQNYKVQVSDYEKRLASLKGFSRQQAEAEKKLKTEREFNERFNKVQRYFKPEEAEVYKQGNQLVIRMRGINFPVGKATLTPENYKLLGKVQQSIRSFNQPTVIIEGHTDSSGSAQINLELSQKRADAVKTYLVANNTLPSNRIKAVGYGAERPLAANTTPEGRAINRRIDVLITPVKTP